MNSTADNGFWSGFRRFFTLKTTGQVLNEQQDQRVRAAKLAAPTGLRGFITKEQQRIDELAARTDKFCGQIEQHFGQYAVYLEQEHGGKTKFENASETSGRKFAIKWVKHRATDYSSVVVAFVLTEAKDHGIRIDYIYSKQDGLSEVPNDNWTGEEHASLLGGKGVYKLQANVQDSFRTVRRYLDMESFLEEGQLPQWFKDILDAEVGTP